MRKMRFLCTTSLVSTKAKKNPTANRYSVRSMNVLEPLRRHWGMTNSSRKYMLCMCIRNERHHHWLHCNTLDEGAEFHPQAALHLPPSSCLEYLGVFKPRPLPKSSGYDTFGCTVSPAKWVTSITEREPSRVPSTFLSAAFPQHKGRLVAFPGYHCASPAPLLYVPGG